jgi:hypothetical protein
MRLVECRQFVAMATRNCATVTESRFHVYEFEMVLDSGVRGLHSGGGRALGFISLLTTTPPVDRSCKRTLVFRKQWRVLKAPQQQQPRSSLRVRQYLLVYPAAIAIMSALVNHPVHVAAMSH